MTLPAQAIFGIRQTIYTEVPSNPSADRNLTLKTQLETLLAPELGVTIKSYTCTAGSCMVDYDVTYNGYDSPTNETIRTFISGRIPVSIGSSPTVVGISSKFFERSLEHIISIHLSKYI